MLDTTEGQLNQNQVAGAEQSNGCSGQSPSTIVRVSESPLALELEESGIPDGTTAPNNHEPSSELTRLDDIGGATTLTAFDHGGFEDEHAMTRDRLAIEFESTQREPTAVSGNHGAASDFIYLEGIRRAAPPTPFNSAAFEDENDALMKQALRNDRHSSIIASEEETHRRMTFFLS